METTFSVILVLSAIAMVSFGHTEVCLKVPHSTDQCYADAKKHPISSQAAQMDCLQRLMWIYEPDQNLTVNELLTFNTVPNVPKSGFRIRREYRTLTIHERDRLHRAFNILYERKVIQKFAHLYYLAYQTTHEGASFLPWHRTFLAIFEEELRKVDPTVSLPFIDVTLEEAMDNPVNSMLWSDLFLGNGLGDVVTGPFANWRTDRGNLYREYGTHLRGKLQSKKMMNKVQQACRNDEISYPLRDPLDINEEEYVLEYHNYGSLNWVGGDMADGAFAPYDPAFYFFLAFVDYQWELFREKQIRLCGVNPITDYPIFTGGQEANDLMFGFGIKNIDGLGSIANWYAYEEAPKCPDCGSQYLYCDKVLMRCVSHSRRADFNVGITIAGPYSGFGVADIPKGPFEPTSDLVPKRTLMKLQLAPLRDVRSRESAQLDARKALYAWMQRPSVPSQRTVNRRRGRQNISAGRRNSNSWQQGQARQFSFTTRWMEKIDSQNTMRNTNGQNSFVTDNYSGFAPKANKGPFNSNPNSNYNIQTETNVNNGGLNRRNPNIAVRKYVIINGDNSME
ncbi:hypothetical protein ACF0H5_006154 [Mactra antiquata]